MTGAQAWGCSSVEEHFPSTDKEDARLRGAAFFPPLSFGVRLCTFCLVALGIEFMCMLGKYCSPKLHPHLWDVTSHQPVLFPKRPPNWSLFQFISVLKPGCLVFLKSLAVEDKSIVLSAEVSHLRILKTCRFPAPHCCRQPELTVLGQAGRHSVFGTSLYFLYLVTLSFPCKNVNLCWQCKERKQENHRFKACLGCRAQNQFKTSLNNKTKILFQRS